MNQILVVYDKDGKILMQLKDISIKPRGLMYLIAYVENRFLYLTSQQQQDSEVLDARKGVDNVTHVSLKSRIDAIETRPYVMFETVEG